MIVAGVYNDLLLLPIPYSIFYLPSAAHGSLSGGVTQIFTPEWSRPLVALPELGCCGFPFPLTTGYDGAKRHPNGSHTFQTYFPCIMQWSYFAYLDCRIKPWSTGILFTMEIESLVFLNIITLENQF